MAASEKREKAHGLGRNGGNGIRAAGDGGENGGGDARGGEWRSTA